MNCKTARGLLSLRLDGGLSFGEERQLSQHLDGCRSCAEELRNLEQAVACVRNLPEIQPSEAFVRDVLQAVRGAREAASIARPTLIERLRDRLAEILWTPSTRFAAAALVLGLTVGIGGSMLAFRPTDGVQTAEQIPPPASTAVASSPANLAGGPIEAPAPSGPFEDLVQEMLRRVESGDEEAADLPAEVPDLDWGSATSRDALGRQVGAESQTGRQRDPKARVTVAY